MEAKTKENKNYLAIFSVLGGISLVVVAIIFALLKLLNFIDWSWWWVTAPIWIPWCASLLALIVALIYYAVFTLKELFKRKDNNAEY